MVYTLLIIDRGVFGGTMVLDFMDFADVSELSQRTSDDHKHIDLWSTELQYQISKTSHVFFWSTYTQIFEVK